MRARRLLAAAALAGCCAGAGAGQRIAWVWDGATAPAWSGAVSAVVVRHVLLTGDEALTRPGTGRPALDTAPGMGVTIPVVHVELGTVHPPVDPERFRARLVATLADAAAVSRSGWVQLDMEARPSQRAFYLGLVRDIRAALPPSVRLSVTALAWWCRSGAWLDDLAADEVVPMFFRMGRDGASLRAIVAGEPARLHPKCRAGAAGFSMQEPFAPEVEARYARTYWFDARHWRDAQAPER